MEYQSSILESMEKLTQFADIYRGKKVLVTGHTGFKGSWLCFWLHSLGAGVIGYSKDIPTTPNHFELLKLPITTVMGDITDAALLKKTFKQYQPDIVFHLAAQALVRDSYEDPVNTYLTNVMGTLQVLESARATQSVRAIVNVTTDKCYENKEQDIAYTEADPMGGYDPYSSSKGCSEILSASYRSSFFNVNEFGKSHSVLLATARSGNVIGGGDWAKDRLIPDIARATDKGTPVELRNPHATRPWQHVLETLSGYLLIGQQLLEKNVDTASAWNLGPSPAQNQEVIEVATEAKKYWPAIDITFSQQTTHAHEAQLLALDSTKAHTQLKWDNVWTFSEGLKSTVEWYKSYYQDKKVITSEQLRTYILTSAKRKVSWITT